MSFEHHCFKWYDFQPVPLPGRAEVRRGLRNFVEMNMPKDYNTDHLNERGVEERTGQHSALQGQEQSVFYQTNIGFKNNVGETAERPGKAYMGLSVCL